MRKNVAQNVIKICANCLEQFVINSNFQKYCVVCKLKLKKEKQYIYNQKLRADPVHVVKNRLYQQKWMYAKLQRIKDDPEYRRRKKANGKRFRMKKGILPNVSLPEKVFFEELKKEYIGEEIQRNIRGIIRNPKTGYPLELDFYIPGKKIAFEVNGPCHYIPVRGGVEKLKANQERDRIKIRECRKMGIKLVVIKV